MNLWFNINLLIFMCEMDILGIGLVHTTGDFLLHMMYGVVFKASKKIEYM